MGLIVFREGVEGFGSRVDSSGYGARCCACWLVPTVET